jgi:hypothetical protein
LDVVLLRLKSCFELVDHTGDQNVESQFAVRIRFIKTWFLCLKCNFRVFVEPGAQNLQGRNQETKNEQKCAIGSPDAVSFPQMALNFEKLCCRGSMQRATEFPEIGVAIPIGKVPLPAVALTGPSQKVTDANS